MKRLASLGAMVGVVSLSLSAASAGVIDPALADVLDRAQPDEVVSALVFLTDRLDVVAVSQDLDAQRARRAERHEIVVSALRERAAATQGNLKAYLETRAAQGAVERFEAFWISNLFRVDATPAEIEAIADRLDVERVYLNHPIEGIHPVNDNHLPAVNGPVPVGAVEPGVVAVRAPEVWAMGINGTGVLVSTLDTGVDGSHPALADRWRGLDPAYAGHPEWAFFDPVTGWTFPQDSGSHGTHTMGTVCGGSPGDQIGVAPGAEWIQAAVIDRVSIAQTVSDAIAAFQWIIDPDGNPATSFDVPDTNSNSWGLTTGHGYPECDETFWSFIDAAEAAGIVVLFSAGNEGPGEHTVRRPADRGVDEYRNLAVAAVDGNTPSFPIASFSSRGPTSCGPNGEDVIKPDISAPGVDVRSSVPGGYSFFNGTSMASPHVNGVVALMREANPDISVEQIKQIIYDTALDLGNAGEDNEYGYGMIDAFEAVQAALGTASLTFSFPEGRPNLIDPNGGTVIPVVVTSQASSPVPGTGRMYYAADGGSYVETVMDETAPGEYEAAFPSFPCQTFVEYYFSVEADTGDTIFNPFSAPLSVYSADAYTGVDVIFQDDFELDLGWTVTDGPGLTSGTWERGTPLGGGDRGDPSQDADGSGQCYVTGIADGDNDIDGGATTLTSPNMDATDPEAMLVYDRWYSNTFGNDPQNDIFVVDVSDDGGASWVNLEVVGPGGSEVSGSWIHKAWPIADIPGVTNSATFRIRFEASDLNDGSVVEAGVDGVEISKIFCDTAFICADINGDNEVGIEEFLAVLGNWGPNPGHPADFDGDDVVGINDLLIVIGNWGECPG